jgi:hypothetical protein
MLLWTQPETIGGLTTYRDDTDWTMYYVLPNEPQFRLENGLPVFRFLKYRFPIDREDGKKGGGFLICDVEFVVPEDKMEEIRGQLQERIEEQWRQMDLQPPAPQVKIGQLSFLRGAANVTFLDSGGALVEKISNPAGPSLYGKMITPITIEMSPEGATLAEQALQDKGGALQVSYDLWTPVKLPPLTATVWFYAEKFMEFYQELHVEERFWFWFSVEDEQRETMRERFSQSESGGVSIDPGTVTDQKVLSAVRDWAWNTLEDGVARRVLGDIPEMDKDAARKLYTEEDIENITRDVFVSKVSSFHHTYTENMVMEWNPAPRGTLPNITSMSGPGGESFEWADFASTVDLNDELFRQLRVTTRANADFETLPLDSVEVKIEYEQGPEHSVQEYSLRSANDVGKFATFIANNSYTYEYSYQVNYENSNRRYETQPINTDETFLTINVGDTGILMVDVAPGDLNFTQAKEAQVTLQYEDQSNGVDLIEQVFKLDADHPDHRWVRVIFAPRREQYRYQVKYFMEDGREFQSGWKTGQSPKLFINDPFSATRTVAIRGFGDFDNRIETIFLDLRYRDLENDYTQGKSVALTKGSTFDDWTFPVIDEGAGRIAYAGTIRLKNGAIQDIPEEIAERDTIMVGDVVLQQAIEVMPDLIAFPTVKLVKVTLRYRDEAAGIDETSDLVFKAGAGTLVWRFPYKDQTKMAYEWGASYFMADGSVKKILPTTTTEETLVLPGTPA